MKAALYCRLSKEDEAKTGESESIQNQKAILIQYAMEHGFEIYQIYSDEDYSGIDRDRPAFNAMIQAASEQKFDVVLAKTQSRFTRDMELVEKYLHGKFTEWGIRFIAVVDRVDTGDAASKKSRQINGLINEWYLEDLSANVRAVLDHKRRAGVYIASFALYGYCKDPAAKGMLRIDPEAAAVVRRIYAMALGGMGARKIARTLNAEGIPNPTAYKQQHGLAYHSMAAARTGLWSSATVYQMLHNRTYTGSLVQGRHKKVSYKSKKTVRLPQAQWITVPGTHAAIIERETFDTVQALLQNRARSGAKGRVHPLARKVVCGVCGSVMEQTSRPPKADETRIRYVRCRLHQRAPDRCPNKTCTDLDALQALVLGRIRAYAANWFDPAGVPLPEPEAPAEKQTKEELRRLQGEVERRRRALQTLYLDKASGLVDEAQYRELRTAFQQELEQVQARMETLQVQQLSAVQSNAALQQRVRELAQLPVLPRELAVLLVHRVVVEPKDPQTGGQDIMIEWNF